MSQHIGKSSTTLLRSPRAYSQAGVWRKYLRISVVGFLVLQGGCAATSLTDWAHNGFKVGPNYCKPPAPIADDWIQADDPRVEKRLINQWWYEFQDPVLSELIQSSYNQNLDLRIAGTRILQARAQQAIAVGSLFPQSQEAFGQYNRVNLSKNEANNPTSLVGVLPPGVSSPFTNYFSDWQAGFNLSWELDFWGRFRRYVESANAQLDASVEDYDAVLVTLQADIATNYTRYRVAQQRIKIAQDNVHIQEEVLALADEKFRVGTSTKLDVEQARSVLEQTRSTIPAFEIELGQANDTLCTLLGMPPQDLALRLGPGTNTADGPIPHTPTVVAAGIPAELLRQRPDIRSAEREIASQSAKIGVAEADLYPAFSIGGTIGYESQNLTTLFESQSFFGSIIPGFRWNILNYGRILNNIRFQESKFLELVATYQNQVLTAAREVQTSLRAFLKSRERADNLARSVEAAKAASELGLQQYRTGTVPFNTVFNLETTQVQQQDQLAVAQGNIALNLINVYRALGGGWEVRLQPPGIEAQIDFGPFAGPPLEEEIHTLPPPAEMDAQEAPLKIEQPESMRQ